MESAEDNQRQAALYTLAAETGYPKQTLAWIAGAICNASDGAKRHVGAEALCAMLVSDVNELHPGDLEGTLRRCGIASSRDIGRVVFALVEKGIVQADGKDAEADFADVFDTAHLDDYLRRAGIVRRRYDATILKRRVVWTLYGLGTAIVLSSWGGIVSSRVGWMGWAAAMIGVAISYMPGPKTRRFPAGAATDSER